MTVESFHLSFIKTSKTQNSLFDLDKYSKNSGIVQNYGASK